MSAVQYIHISMEIWGVVFCLIAAVCVHVTRRFEERVAGSLCAILLTDAALNANEALAYYFRGNVTRTGYFMVRITNFTVFVCGYLLALFTCRYLGQILVVQRERLLTGEIGRIDALLKTLDGQQDRLEERLEVLAEAVPEDEEPMNTTAAREVGSTQVITSEMDEAAFLRSQIVEIRRRKDGLYAERAESANTEVQIRLLLELVDEMVKNSLPEWMAREAETVEETGACRDYDDFFSRTKYTVPEGVLAEDGSMARFENDLVIRYLDRIVVCEDCYEVVFKAGVQVRVET